MASISPAPTSNLTSSAGESFAALFEESLNRKEMRIGEVITAEVVSVDENFVVVNAGLKSGAGGSEARRLCQRFHRGP